MELVLIGGVGLLASLLTFFSGFGLGTLLMPVFALFFPVPVAIAATAVVHGANNLFKLALLARQAHWPTVWHFGLPAMLAALAGAALLAWLGQMPVLVSYTLGSTVHQITVVKVLIGLVLLAFVWLELSERLEHLAIPARWLPLGGVLSGFFGGLSGNQGALRSAFLLRAGLCKEAYVATGVIGAVMVDSARLLVYGQGETGQLISVLALPVTVAVGAAFAGALLGKRLLPKVTLRTVQRLTAGLMFGVALGMIAGAI